MRITNRGLSLVCLAVFLIALTGCGVAVQEPGINRAGGPLNERTTYMPRAAWFPVTYFVDDRGTVTGPDLETLFQKVSDWIENNEGRISSHSVTVVNATVFVHSDQTGSNVIIPSGVLITYTLK